MDNVSANFRVAFTTQLYERMACFAEAVSDLIELRDGYEPAGFFVAKEESSVSWGVCW